jgi:hypothetical protein
MFGEVIPCAPNPQSGGHHAGGGFNGHYPQDCTKLAVLFLEMKS